MSLQRDLTRAVALHYGLRKQERKVFNAGWPLKHRSDEFERNNETRLDAEVDGAFELLRRNIAGEKINKRGHRYIERRPVTGKYVVFSDHHFAYAGHRQNFFASSGNRSLYTRLLSQYYARDYTLVEAGDVEELIVFEPTLAEVQRRTEMSWAELDRHRVTYRLGQLGKILDDPGNAELYRCLDMFAHDNRLVRIAGNHDYDLQRKPLFDRIRQRVPHLHRPRDYLLLDSRSGACKYAIMHGHQFDRYANPRYAPRLGEVISETLAWAFQGADRVWLWNDDVRDWVSGERPFNDNLVVDDYQRPRWPPTRTGGRRFWEWLFKHNVAWEYFESKTANQAVLNEVLKGDEFFKYRHLDEVHIHEQMLRMFPRAASRPRLLLGHTHEARLRPSVPGKLVEHWTPDDSYLNSGAAGRFENLIWGIEIVDGEAKMISWSFAGGPGRFDTAVERREWEVVSSEIGPSFLCANKRPSPLR